MVVAVILDTSFYSGLTLNGSLLQPVHVVTDFGPIELFRYNDSVIVVPRNEIPPCLLPHQVPFKAIFAALRVLGCDCLLTVDSVVAAVDLPNQLYFVKDIFFPSNTLPNGIPCTMYEAKTSGKKNILLKITNGLINTKIVDQLSHIIPNDQCVNAYYFPGPRNMTACELKHVAASGCEVVSSYIPPELVLANELMISCCAIVSVIHDYSYPDYNRIEELDESRNALLPAIMAFIEKINVPEYHNEIHSQDPVSK